MKIAIPLVPEVTALDAVGPYEVLQRLPGATVTFVGEEVGTVRTDNGFLGMSVDATISDVPRPDVIVVPGGIGTRRLIYERSPILDWLAAAHATTKFTTSVCTGSIVLAAAGLLQGLTATTHWSVYDMLETQGAVATEPIKVLVTLLPTRMVDSTRTGCSTHVETVLPARPPSSRILRA